MLSEKSHQGKYCIFLSLVDAKGERKHNKTTKGMKVKGDPQGMYKKKEKGRKEVKKVRWSEYEQSSLYACKEMK
jgi:hypothetical protein